MHHNNDVVLTSLATVTLLMTTMTLLTSLTMQALMMSMMLTLSSTTVTMLAITSKLTCSFHLFSFKQVRSEDVIKRCFTAYLTHSTSFFISVKGRLLTISLTIDSRQIIVTYVSPTYQIVFNGHHYQFGITYRVQPGPRWSWSSWTSPFKIGLTLASFLLFFSFFFSQLNNDY